MQVRFGESQIQLLQGDIVAQAVEAIVNAANPQLAGGGGVDGAIHRAAGPTLMEQTGQQYPAGCPTGSAVVTEGANLPARFVIHAVGPIWRGGQHREEELLRSAIHRSLELAVEHGCRSIAFPAISTGAYGYPVDLAAEAALAVVRDFLCAHQQPQDVRFVLFDAGTFGAFARVLESMVE